MRATLMLIAVQLLAFGGCGIQQAHTVDSLGSVTTVISQEVEKPENADVAWIFSPPAKVEFTRSEVTTAEFRKCVEFGACKAADFRTKAEDPGCNWGYDGRDDHPMNCVTWNGAKEFCEWAGGRLPDEEEWYAEASDAGQRKYPWGGDEADCTHAVMDDSHSGCGQEHTWPVCSRKEGNSVSGLCDMSGNVWEWTSSEDGASRVLRGGGWLNFNQSYLSASGRLTFSPTYTSNYFGLRCVRDPKPE